MRLLRVYIVGLQEHNGNLLRTPQKRYFMGVIKVYFHSSFTLERDQQAALENSFIYLTCFFSLIQYLIRRSFFLKCTFSLPIQVQKPSVTSRSAVRNTSGSFVSTFQRSVSLQIPCFGL